jgi:predicted TIM-barrel fold metal-dependent hydrolase
MQAIDEFFEVRRDPEQRVTFLPEPSQREVWCPVISVDDHVLEPPTLFDKIASSARDEAPRLIDGPSDYPVWVVEDRRIPILNGNGMVNRPWNERQLYPQRLEEFRDGVWKVDDRVRDMNLNGVWGSLNFPSHVWGFAGKVFSRMRNSTAGLEALRAYNRWMLEDWCGAHSERFIPCQVPWLQSPEVGAREIHENAARGFRAVSFSENPEALGFAGIHSREWDPFFAACEETETVVNLHVGSSGNVQKPSKDSPHDVTIALFPVNGVIALIDWVYSKIPIRFPGLKIVLSEAGVSWVPMALERLKRAYRQREATGSWASGDPEPVEVVARNFWFTSIEDPSAFHQLDRIGLDRVMVEVDYPHDDTTWPDTQDMVRSELGHLDRPLVERLCYGTAAELYRHPVPTSAWFDSLRVES